MMLRSRASGRAAMDGPSSCPRTQQQAINLDYKYSTAQREIT
jgi:hypothetical protein